MGYPGKIIHQTFRVFENLVVDPLQSVAVQRIPVFAKQQKGIKKQPKRHQTGAQGLFFQGGLFHGGRFQGRLFQGGLFQGGLFQGELLQGILFQG